MEGNRDESERCINLAEKCVAAGDSEKARKFLAKAERLYPSKKAKDLLNRLATSDKNSHTSKEESSESVRQRSASGSSSQCNSNNECHEIQPKYTQEQLESVKKIRRCKDYYEILGVQKDCEDEDIKKSYRKLALKFHPDKNHAPGATEAFKAIGNAFAVLSDTQKRRRYDQFGTDEPELRRSRRSDGYEYDFSRGFESDVSAEELFRMFFGGSVFTADNHRTQRAHRTQPRNDQNPYTFLFQLCPLIFVIVVSLLSSLFVGQSVFSLHRNAKYIRERRTQSLGVTYYVRDDFVVPKSSAELGRLERQVEEDYVVELQQNCYRERNNREAAMWRAQMYGNSDLYRQAANIQMKSCERLRQINIGSY